MKDEKELNKKTKKILDASKRNRTMTNKPADTIEINPEKETPERQTQ